MNHSPSLYFYHLNKMIKFALKKIFIHNYVIILNYNKEFLNMFITYMYCHSYRKWKSVTNQKL